MTGSINNFLWDTFRFRLTRVAPDIPRESTKYAKREFENKPIIVIEVGTYKGANALSILKKLNVEKIYLIDPYINYSEYSHKLGNLSSAEKEARKKLRKYKKKIVWIKKTSDEAVDLISEKADFVYIEGNHDYKYVKKDLKNYFPKVKKGGILAGHDMPKKGVSNAIWEFSIKKKLDSNTSGTDWWILKK